MRYKIVITDTLFEDNNKEIEVLKKLDAEVIICKNKPKDELFAICRDADALLVNMINVDKEFIENLEKCKVISRYGGGYDNVDAIAAEKAGIWLATVPDYCYVEVAEHALALLLAASRSITIKNNQVREGMWRESIPYSIKRIRGTVLGIVGYGGTGKEFQKISAGLGFSRTLIHSRSLKPGTTIDNCEVVDFDTLVKESDYISLHLPLTEDTRNMFSAEQFLKMKNDSIIINCSRGPIINETDLFNALKSGKIRAAGLDVFAFEPPVNEDNLFSLNNVVLTDHSAYHSDESLELLKEKTAENVVKTLNEGNPVNSVNNPTVN